MSRIALSTCQCCSSRVVLVLLTLDSTVAGVNEQVEGIVVEVELIAVFLRETAEGCQSTIVITLLIVVASISAGFGTVVSLNDTLVDFSRYRLLGSSSAIVVEPCIQVRLLVCCQVGVAVEILGLAELEGVGHHVRQFYATGHRCPLVISIVLLG